jgi:hypothetical protein
MDTGSYLCQSQFDLPPVLPNFAAQERIPPHYIGSQPFTGPHPQPTPTAMLPAASVELTDLIMSDIRSSPRRSPRETSRISGPSMPLSTTGVALYSHSPTTPLNRASQSPGFAGPGSVTGTDSRQSPISPVQKRSFEASADDSLVCRPLNFFWDVVKSCTAWTKGYSTSRWRI